MPISPNTSACALTLPAGMRATRAVQALLCLLPQQPDGGWTESLVEVALQQQGVQVNRVTVYRALDRLAQAGLLARTVDAQRMTRYSVVDPEAPMPLAHMECRACHQAMDFDAGAAAVQTALQALRQAVMQTTGVHHPVVDVAVQGECDQCANGAAPSVFSSTT